MTPIIVAMRAPELSATSNLDRICTIGILLVNDFHEAPSLELAERPRFHDTNSVPGLRLVLFVVRIKFFHLLDDLAEFRMRHARDCPHHDGLVHAAGNHLACARLPRTTGYWIGLVCCWW